MDCIEGKKINLKGLGNYSTGKNWNAVSVRQNYKIYVLSEKEWILCILQSIGITGIINFSVIDPGGHGDWEFRLESGMPAGEKGVGRAETADSTESF